MAYKLTPLGETMARRVQISKGPENAVMVFMYGIHEPVEIEEIAGETRLTDETAERVMTRLVSMRYVKEI